MRYLKQREVDEIKKLREEKVMIKDIAKRFLVCEATISNVVNGKTPPRKIKSVGSAIRSPYDPIEFKEEVFSTLPNDVFFQHGKAKDFIG